MRKKHASLIIGVVTSIVMTSSSAFCQRSHSGTTISAVSGLFIPGGAEQLKAGPLFGIKAGKSLTDIMDMEGDLTMILADSEEGGSAQAYQLSLQFLYQVYESTRWTGFLTFGAGGIFISGGSSSGALLDFGVGGKYELSQDWALRGDLRQIIATESIGNNTEVSLGVSYYFDRPDKRQTAARRRVQKKIEVAAPAAEASPTQIASTLASAPFAPEPKTIPAESNVEPDASQTPVAPVQVAQMAPATQGITEVPVVPAAPVVPSTTEILLYSDTKVEAAKAEVPVEAPATAPTMTASSSGPAPLPEAAQQQVHQTEAKPVKPTRVVQTILFEVNSAFIAKKYLPKLAIIVKAMKQHPTAKAKIHGHTDSSGAELTNRKLSAMRADSVKYQLVKAGIDPSRLSRAGFSSSKPIASNSNRSGKQANRRAVTVVTVELSNDSGNK